VFDNSFRGDARDIHFNLGRWDDLIESQAEIFRKDRLRTLSDGLRNDFLNCQHAAAVNQVIPSEDYVAPCIAPLSQEIAGYDLPCLFSGDRPTKGTVMLCAQDPLRGAKSETGISVGTFFGVNSFVLRRNRAQHGIMWRLVRKFVDTGFDVWATDARKLFIYRQRLSREQNELCRDVLLKEIELVDPVRIVGFGNQAQHQLRSYDLGREITPALHPSSRLSSQWGLVGQNRDYDLSDVDERCQSKVDRYWREIMAD